MCGEACNSSLPPLKLGPEALLRSAQKRTGSLQSEGQALCEIRAAMLGLSHAAASVRTIPYIHRHTHIYIYIYTCMYIYIYIKRDFGPKPWKPRPSTLHDAKATTEHRPDGCRCVRAGACLAVCLERPAASCDCSVLQDWACDAAVNLRLSSKLRGFGVINDAAAQSADVVEVARLRSSYVS